MYYVNTNHSLINWNFKGCRSIFRYFKCIYQIITDTLLLIQYNLDGLQQKTIRYIKIIQRLISAVNVTQQNPKGLFWKIRSKCNDWLAINDMKILLGTTKKMKSNEPINEE